MSLCKKYEYKFLYRESEKSEKVKFTHIYFLVQIFDSEVKEDDTYLMVICGRSPFSDLRSMSISRMVWDQYER